MNDNQTKPSELAGPVTSDKKDLFNNEWQNTEVNLNHLDLEVERKRVNALKKAYHESYVYMPFFSQFHKNIF